MQKISLNKINIPQITAVTAIEILDSRGTPTIEVEVVVNASVVGRAAVPSGASCGLHEAFELRDLDKQRYAGKGVLQAVKHVNTEIAAAVIGKDAVQGVVDTLLYEIDGTLNKSRLGANAILATSLAVCKAVAKFNAMPLYQYIAYLSQVNTTYDNDNNKERNLLSLPVPLLNVINGGVHAANNLDLQEFMLVPVGASSFAESLRFGAEITFALKTNLKELGLVTAVGDEGGFAPNLTSNQVALDLLIQAIYDVGLVPGKDVYLALDVAASELYRDNLYHLEAENKALSSSAFGAYLINLANNYPILSIEDGMSEADFIGWQFLTSELGNKLQLVGDDLFVTNSRMLAFGIDKAIANAILIKPNQIGTLSETIATVHLAKQNNYSAIISHRSGETEDSMIADLAVGLGCGQIKAGALCRGERIAKYNQLLRIAYANVEIPFAGVTAFTQYM